jgi:hypothetical protein
MALGWLVPYSAPTLWERHGVNRTSQLLLNAMIS